MSSDPNNDYGYGLFQIYGPFFGKRCARCHHRFPRMGAEGYRLIGIVFCFLLFGGTSKYCESCRAAIYQERSRGTSRYRIDKGWLFRLIWFIIALPVMTFIMITLFNSCV